MTYSALLVTEGVAGIAITSLVTLVSSAAAANFSASWGNPARLSTVLSIGCGYLFGLAFFELLPHSYRHFDGSFLSAGALALIGALLVLFIDRCVNRSSHRRSFRTISPAPNFSNIHKFGSINLSHKACCSIHTTKNMSAETAYAAMACIGVCVFFDGVTLSATLLASEHVSITSFFGVFGHVVPEVMLVGLLARAQKGSRAKALLFCTGATLLFIVGNLLSQVAGYIGFPDGALFGISSGIVAYIALSHLIPKLRSGWQERSFALIGLCCFFLTELLHQHH